MAQIKPLLSVNLDDVYVRIKNCKAYALSGAIADLSERVSGIADLLDNGAISPLKLDRTANPNMSEDLRHDDGYSESDMVLPSSEEVLSGGVM